MSENGTEYLVGSFPTAAVVWWSELLTTDPEVRVRFPALLDFLSSESGRGPLSLASTIEELLGRKVAAPV
jgi:hypothetical protein